ncbi:MAG TPA: tRNA (guanosine(46)-N7)-methyltransferase TrmB [Rikenellaceae bacterium]|nr:tRNA (guanosine(46)-N7)-methyltransferase TrmB [Rikenellaceae bacterium]
MGHDKLRKFAENETFSCLLQPEASSVLDKFEAGNSLRLKDHPIKGHWNERMFKADQPIVLELGCGKGEYTIDLSRREPSLNYIGVDIKGARLWKGAKFATENNLPNVAFLRTRIEFIDAFFALEEVSEIWLTFSDPQMKSENCRLTSPLFLERYRKFLKKGGIVHLKTDSRFLYEYSRAVAEQNDMNILACTNDLYGTGRQDLADCALRSVAGESAVDALFEVQTFYEKMFSAQGYKITYLSFVIDHVGPYIHPDFDSDYWRSIEGPRHFTHQPEKQH